LITRPLGVKGVANPLAALGGADREGIDQARRNAPLAVTALDRLVSVQDFEDFARTFAGIGKSSAKRFARDGSELVHLTVAGADDISLDERSDVYRNLKRALATSGDPFVPFMVSRRELVTVVISAEVRILPEYLWEKVAQTVRDNLAAAFGFNRRELGQPLYLSEVYSIAQAVEGVDFVNVTAFGGIPELGDDRNIITFDKIRQLIEGPDGIANTPPAESVAAQLARVAPDGSILPAQIALLLPAVPDTLILKEVTW
jgi:predicted phage baseplate assembly protein